MSTVPGSRTPNTAVDEHRAKRCCGPCGATKPTHADGTAEAALRSRGAAPATLGWTDPGARPASVFNYAPLIPQF